jgi:hypothetical protein
MTSANFFSVFGVAPAQGRVFIDAETGRGMLRSSLLATSFGMVALPAMRRW